MRTCWCAEGAGKAGHFKDVAKVEIVDPDLKKMPDEAKQRKACWKRRKANRQG